MCRLSHRLAILAVALASARFALAAEAEKPSEPSAEELVAAVAAEEAKFDSVQSLYLRFEDHWTTPPALIARRLETLQKQFPTQKWDATTDSGLMPEITGQLELSFDERRARKLTDWHKAYVDARVYDGTRTMWHSQQSGTEGYALNGPPQQLFIGGYFFQDLSWGRMVPHPLWLFHGGIPAANERFKQRGQYRLVGKADFAGRQCYVLENRPAKRRLHIGVDDRRLHGLTELYSYSGLDTLGIEALRPFTEHSLNDYRELAPGFWFPAEQGYTGYQPDGSGPDFATQRRLHLVESKVNQPLPDELFTLPLKDGIGVSDASYDPQLLYKQKADRTPDEWQEIMEEWRAGEGPGRHTAGRKTMVGKPVPEFPKGDWINSEPLSLAQLRGKIVVLAFWAAWVPSCLDDLPLAEKAHQNAADTNLVVIGVHATTQTRTDVEEFAKRHKLSFPILIDSATQLPAIRWGVTFDGSHVDSLPYSLLIDEDGKIAGHGSLADMLAAADALHAKSKK